MTAPSILRSAKHKVLNYTPTQIKVRDATASNTPSPDINQLIELAILTYDKRQFNEMIDILLKRMNSDGKYWHHVLKSLIVAEFLIINGEDIVYNWFKRNIQQIKTLKAFQRYDKKFREVGEVVRHQANKIYDLLTDEIKFDQAREEAKDITNSVKAVIAQNQNRYVNSMQLSGPVKALSSNALNTDFNSIDVSNRPPNINVQTKQISAEIQKVVPLTPEEEENQLLVALALSREEAENSKRNRLNELSFSQNNFQNSQIHSRSSNNIDNVLDLAFGDMSITQTSQSDKREVLQSNMFGYDINPWYTPKITDTMLPSNPQENEHSSKTLNRHIEDNPENIIIENQQHFDIFDETSSFFRSKSDDVPQSSQKNEIQQTYLKRQSVDSNSTVDNFLGMKASDLVNLSDFESRDNFSIRPQYNKCNPFSNKNSEVSTGDLFNCFPSDTSLKTDNTSAVDQKTMKPLFETNNIPVEQPASFDIFSDPLNSFTFFDFKKSDTNGNS